MLFGIQITLHMLCWWNLIRMSNDHSIENMLTINLLF